jgi:hypothetical protein
MFGLLLRQTAREPLKVVMRNLKRLVRRNQADRQVLSNTASIMPWLFRSLKATCLVLRKQGKTQAISPACGETVVADVLR